MTKIKEDIVELFIDSTTEHAAAKHLKNLRNEDSAGKQLTGGRSKGDPLSAFDKEDFRIHLRSTLSNPETQYFIDESNGRITFFNEDAANRSRIIFNPAQILEGDGHAGTIMRDEVRLSSRAFDHAKIKASNNMGGIEPEVRSVSDGKWAEHLEKYREQLSNVPERVFGKGDLRTDYHRAGGMVKNEPLPLLELENTAKLEKSVLHSASEATVSALKVAGKTAKFLPILGTALGVGINTAEAREMEEKLQVAVDNGQVSKEALLEYDAILAGHIAQGGDPSVVLGEAPVQGAFEVWANRYNVQSELRDSLRPQSLALMVKDGAGYIAGNIDRLPQASIDVASFAGQQAMAGAGAAATSAAGVIANTYDHVTGHAAQRQAVYDALPVLAQAANEDMYDPCTIDDPIHSYPAAYNLAQIKTGIVNTQAMIAGINNGTREPFNGMNKAESAEFLQESVDRLDERFKDSYAQAGAEGTLDEVMDYTAYYGAANTEKAALPLTVLDSVAANQPFDAPKLRAL